MKKQLLCTFALQGVFVLLGLVYKAQAQELRHIKGRVVLAADSARPLPYVQVVNRSRGNGAVSDLEGYFRLRLADTDSIEFRMIGYQDTLISARDLRSMGYRFPMKEKIITLKPVTIRGERNYKPFAPPEKKSDDPYVGYRSVKPSGREITDQKMGLTTTGNGAALEGAITEFANMFSKKAKQRKRVDALKTRARYEEYYNALHEYWFDKKIVAELTGYKGKELDKFIAFCKPSLQFLEEATDYQVILTIWHYKKQYDVLHYRDY